jgi:ATP-dependent Clp protease ATP-binding subunit ClpA
VVRALIEKMALSPARVSEVVEKQIESLPVQQGGADPYVSASLKRIIQGAFTEADGLKDKFVSTEHLFLSMTRDRRDPAGELLISLGVQRERL